MKVKAIPIKTTAGTYYVLKNTGNNSIIHNAPNKWKTKRGAENWASNNGLTVQVASKRPKKQQTAPKPVHRRSRTEKKK